MRDIFPPIKAPNLDVLELVFHHQVARELSLPRTDTLGAVELRRVGLVVESCPTRVSGMTKLVNGMQHVKYLV